MPEKKYILLDGKYFGNNEPLFTIANRGFRYGDGVFETIRVIKGRVYLLADHLQRVRESAKYLKIDLPESFQQDKMEKYILELAEKNGVSETARIRLTVFREDGGYYEPLENTGHWVLEADEYDRKTYTLNRQGLKIDLFSTMDKPTGLYSNLKSTNCHIYVMASLFKKSRKLDSCLIANTKNRVAEAISSNVFFVKDGKVSTPALTEGCVAGVMRAHVIDLLQKNDVPFLETPIALEEIFMADEIFLTDALNGIRWVSNYKIKEYELNVTRELSAMLDKFLKKNG